MKTQSMVCKQAFIALLFSFLFIGCSDSGISLSPNGDDDTPIFADGDAVEIELSDETSEAIEDEEFAEGDGDEEAAERIEEDEAANEGLEASETEETNERIEQEERKPPDCNDDNPCTIDAFDTETDACAHAPACAEANRSICHIGDEDAITCLCNEGFTDDGRGACIEGTAGGMACDDAIGLTFRQGVVLGDTSGAGDNAYGDCNDYTSEEQVYYFEVLEEASVVIEATGFDTLLYLRTLCDDIETEIACDDDSGTGYAARLEVTLGAGVYFLFVDGYHGQGGEYELHFKMQCDETESFDYTTGLCKPNPCKPNPCTEENRTRCEPDWEDETLVRCLCDAGFVEGEDGLCDTDPAYQGESCAWPYELPVESDSFIEDTTLNRTDDGEGSCSGTGNGGNGADVVYHFVLDAPHRAEFLMDGNLDGGETEYDTLLHLRSRCDEVASEIACNDDAVLRNAGLSLELEAGEYFLYADSWQEPGMYRLNYSFTKNPCEAREETLCPGDPVCTPYADWSDYVCLCPEGTIYQNGNCIDNPCEPNPCNEIPMRTNCRVDMETITHYCECAPGFIDGEGGACVTDPEAAVWSVMIFLNGDNNLEEVAYGDIEEMVSAGFHEAVNVVVLLDSYEQDGGTARKLLITEGGVETLEDMGEVDMGDWRTLRNFGIWAAQTYPAQHYAYIIWNHGEGWSRRSALDSPPPFKSFSTDDHGSNDGISVAQGEYAQAMEAIAHTLGRKLDIIAFDACLMGMWEVAYESMPFADLFVASEETIPITGYDYDALLRPLMANPDTSPEAFARSMATTYHDDIDENSTLSVLDINQMPGFTRALSTFADAMAAADEHFDTLELHRAAGPYFGYRDAYRDIGDFAARVQADETMPEPVRSAAENLLTMLEAIVIENQTQADYAEASGIAIYFPKHGSDFRTLYQAEGATWSEASRWDEFLLSFTTGR